MKEQERRLASLKSYILTKDPSFSSILLWCAALPVESDYIACTDGVCMFFGKKFFLLSDKEQVGVMLHEMMHIALCHIPKQRALNLKPYEWNIACDSIINEGLKKLTWCSLPRDGIYLGDIIDSETLRKSSLSTWTSNLVYFYLLKNPQKTPPKSSWAGNDLSSDERLQQPSITLPSYAKDLYNQTEETRQSGWEKKLERARQESISDSVLRDLEKEFPKVNTPWQSVFKNLMTSPLIAKRLVNWSRCSRRMQSTASNVFQPGYKKALGIPKAGLVVDTSGSIDGAQLLLFLAEVQSIQEKTGAEIILVYADDKVAADYIIKNDGTPLCKKIQQGQYQAAGNGGTNFRPALEFLKDKGISVCVYLTDMHGEFGLKPKEFPVIWASTSKGIKAPFGRTIELD